MSVVSLRFCCAGALISSKGGCDPAWGSPSGPAWGPRCCPVLRADCSGSRSISQKTCEDVCSLYSAITCVLVGLAWQHQVVSTIIIIIQFWSCFLHYLHLCWFCVCWRKSCVWMWKYRPHWAMPSPLEEAKFHPLYLLFYLWAVFVYKTFFWTAVNLPAELPSRPSLLWPSPETSPFWLKS